MADAIVVRCVQGTERVLCTREIQRSIKSSVHQLLKDRIEAHSLSDLFTVTDNVIRGHNGSLIQFAGLRTNPESIKSMEGITICWCEEASSISQRSLDLLIPTVRKPGSEIWFSFNRHKPTDPVGNMFLGGKPPPDTLMKRMNWSDNRWFPDVLRDEMLWMKNRDRDKWLHVWEGEPLRRSAATVFKHWKEDDLGDGKGVMYCGADWGFSVDPSVLVGCFIMGNILYVRHEAYKIGVDPDNLPSLFAGTDKRTPKRWRNNCGFPGVPNVMKYRIIADSQRPDTIRHLKKRGFNIVSAKKGPRSIEEGIDFLQSFDIVVHPACKHTINELELYSYEVDPLTDEVLPKLSDKDNHVIDSLRYALETVRKRGKIPVGVPEDARYGPKTIVRRAR